LTTALTARTDSSAPGPSEQRTFVTGARLLALATVAIGAVNYLYSLGLTHLLDVQDFAVFAAGQALLLSAGTVSSTSVPWVLAKALARAGSVHERRQAIWFAVVTNGALGLVAGLVTTVLALRFSSALIALLVGGATFLVFLSSTTIGLLQGEQRFGALGGLRVVDAVLKLVFGVALVLLGAGAAGALSGFAVGSLALVAAAVVLAGRDIRPTAGALRLRSLWISAAGVAGVQGLVSVLLTVDLFLVAVLAASAADAATYQASMILSRVPLFLAGAVSASVFALLTRTTDSGRDAVRTAVRLYLLLVLPFAVTLATVPPELLDLLFPDEYSGMALLLPLTTAAGLCIGGVSLVTTFFQARGLYRPSVRAQLLGLLVHVPALVLGHAWAGVTGLAVGGVVGSVSSILLLTLAAPRAWRSALLPGPGLVLGCAALGGVLLLLRPSPVAWLGAAVLAGALVVARWARRQSFESPEPGADGPAEQRPLRILHLGFEDWRKPGSGGGAVRTREVDERLAQRHQVTVLVSRYRGARERVENGVRWVPIGLPLGYWGGILSYFAALPFAARRHRADLVVEDFAAPIGSLLPQLWTRRPLVAVVQWLNAEEKARQYHLPFHLVQRRGVRRHHHFVAMSEDLADRLRSGNPAADVTVVPNGVPRGAFDVRAERGNDVVFLGRLEIAQKGLDLLLDAVAAVPDELPGRLVLAGDGPDRRALEVRAQRLGIADRVVFAGRVEGADKLALLAGARLVAMPSRFETFGIVAAEALACGTPVVAFEIPSLREVVAPGTGVLVPAFDVAAFGRALVELARDRERVEAMGRQGRAHARRYDWDDVAAQQEAVYLRVAGTGRSADVR
jgi:glycosyltransferase involved in cell wall biosynthesis/O-antigen/teichoic acid export membrane protein